MESDFVQKNNKYFCIYYFVQLKRVSYHVKEILYVFYDPYYDKIKVIPSVLEFTLDIKNAIYVDKFKLEKFLTKNNNLISNPKDLNKINTKDFNYVDKYTIFLCLKKKYGLLKSIKYTIKLFNKNK